MNVFVEPLKSQKHVGSLTLLDFIPVYTFLRIDLLIAFYGSAFTVKCLPGSIK